MHRTLNVVLIALVSGFLAIPLLCGALSLFESDNDPGRSYLEGRAYQGFPEISVDGFASNVFQDKFEVFLADSIPFREEVVLSNACAQRHTIGIANLLFGFNAYPTFFGSDYYVDPTAERVVETPYKGKDVTGAAAAAAESLRDLMFSNPQIDWKIAIPERMASSAGSPLTGLVQDSIANDSIVTLLRDVLGESCVVDLGDCGISYDPDGYFTTDHHWQVESACAAYLIIMESFERSAVYFAGFETVYQGPFYGSSARAGLITDYCDSVDDVVYDHGDFDVLVNGKQEAMSFLDASWSDEYSSYQKPNRFANVYADYFHSDYGLIEIRNPDTAANGVLLMVGDSFTNNMERFFAESYEVVYVLDPRHYDGTVTSFLVEHEVDDALVLMGINNFISTDWQC